jgi:hypothetical protein
MADEPSPSSTGATTTTTGTTTTPADGSATATGQTNDGGLHTALGDGTGQKPAADATADGAPKPADKPATGAPETYSPWTAPEGYELDAGLVEEASPIFRELGLTQEQSQKLVDFYSKHSLAAADASLKAFTDMRAEWRQSMKTDDTLSKLADSSGNFGPKSPLVDTVNRALDGLQNPKLVSDFKDAMNLTGAGDNPAFVRVLHALAKQVTEGTSYATGGPVQSKSSRPSPGAAMYPHLPPAG